jgi:hypothetical protein
VRARAHMQPKKTFQSKLAHRKTSTSQTRRRTIQVMLSILVACYLNYVANSLETYVLTYAYRHQTPGVAGEARNLLFFSSTWTRIH